MSAVPKPGHGTVWADEHRRAHGGPSDATGASLGVPRYTVAAARGRALLSQPDRVAVILWAAGVVAGASVLPLSHWPRPLVFARVIAISVAIVCGGLRAAVGPRLPHWSLHVDVALGNSL